MRKFAAVIAAVLIATAAFAQTGTILQAPKTSVEPYRSAVAINISAADHASLKCRAIYVGTGGAAKTLKVDLVGDSTTASTITFTGVVSGTIYPLRVSKVYKTGTDAADMVCLW